MHVRTAITLVIAVSIVTVVAVVVPFYLTFAGEPIQRDSGAWANFGSYIGGVLGPVLGLVNLFVVAYIAIHIADLQQRNLVTKRLSIDLYAEWHAPILHESRRQVSNMLAAVERGERRLPTLSELEQTGDELSLHAFRLYHFFERWSVLAQQKELDEDILRRALASRAQWYQERFFTPLRECETDSYMRKALEEIEEHVFVPLAQVTGRGPRDGVRS